jgi:cation:H+ antiporter
LSNIDLKIGWVGLDSLTLIIVYIVAIWIIQSNNSISAPPVSPREEDLVGVPKLVNAILGFLIASGILVVVTPWLVESSALIAEITGLGMSFVGTTLLAFVTSLPELVTTMTAVRLGASDLAIGNLFGSNMFNMFALGLSDLFFLNGRYLGSIDPSFVIIGLLGLIMTGMGLIGNLVRLERKIFFIEIDALLLILVYVGGLYFLYTQGINP